MLRLLSGLVVGVLVARFLGPENYGLLNYAMSFTALFLAFSGLGLDSIMVRELLNHPDLRTQIMGTAFRLKMIAAIIILLLVFVAVMLGNETTEVKIMMLILASAALFQSFSVIEYFFQSEVQSKLVVYANVISLIITSGLKIWLIIIEAELVFFAVAFTLDAVVVAAGMVYFYRIAGHTPLDWKFDLGTARDLLRQSWPLVLASVVITVYMKIDQIMIKDMLGPAENGYYAAAVRISETWYFIPMAICNSLFPAIINAKNRADGSYEIRLQRLFDLMVGLALLVAIPITLLSKPLILLLFGPDYASAAGVLTVHIWAGLFVSLGVSGSLWLVSEKLQKLSFYRTATGAVVNIVLNFIFIPRYGIVGAAVTTLISQFMAALFFDVFFKRTRGVFLMKMKALLLISPIRKLLKP